VHLGLTSEDHVELVSDDDTAIAAHSGDVPVLSTPRIVALCEEAAVAAVAGQLAEGETTVGMRVQLDHLAPIAVGSTVTAERQAREGRGPSPQVLRVGDRRPRPRGRRQGQRVVVERERFMDKCS
jgi:fluoroacetyl-CoA thioesterase